MSFSSIYPLWLCASPTYMAHRLHLSVYQMSEVHRLALVMHLPLTGSILNWASPVLSRGTHGDSNVVSEGGDSGHATVAEGAGGPPVPVRRVGTPLLRLSAGVRAPAGGFATALITKYLCSLAGLVSGQNRRPFSVNALLASLGCLGYCKCQMALSACLARTMLSLPRVS